MSEVSKRFPDEDVGLLWLIHPAFIHILHNVALNYMMPQGSLLKSNQDQINGSSSALSYFLPNV